MELTKHTESNNEKWIALVLGIDIHPKILFFGGLHETEEMAKRAILWLLFEKGYLTFTHFDFEKSCTCDKLYRRTIWSKIKNFKNRFSKIKTHRKFLETFIDDIIHISTEKLMNLVAFDDLNYILKKIKCTKKKTWMFDCTKYCK